MASCKRLKYWWAPLTIIPVFYVLSWIAIFIHIFLHPISVVDLLYGDVVESIENYLNLQ